MALTNVFREPRRELTESAVGLGIFSVYLFLDYQFSIWFQAATIDGNGGCPWGLGMLIGLILTMISILVLFATHEFGDFVCNSLARHGLELRPKNRR